MGRSTQSAKRIVSGGAGPPSPHPKSLTRFRPPHEGEVGLTSMASTLRKRKTVYDQAHLLPSPAAASEPRAVPGLLAERPRAAGEEEPRAVADPSLRPVPRHDDGTERSRPRRTQRAGNV